LICTFSFMFCIGTKEQKIITVIRIIW